MSIVMLDDTQSRILGSLMEKQVTTPDQKDGDFGIDVTLTPWIILTSDTEMVLPTDWVVTIVEPMASLKQMYVDKSKTFKVTEGYESETLDSI